MTDQRSRRAALATLALLASLVTLIGSPALASTGDAAFRRAVQRIPTSSAFSPALRSTIALLRNERRLADPQLMAAVDDPRHPATPRYLIRLTTPIGRGGYRTLQFGAASGPGGGSFGAATYRSDERSSSDQIYEWQHRAPAHAVRVWSGTRHARLVISTNLASVSLGFTPTGETRTRTFDCEHVLGGPPYRVTWTRGTLVGSFDFSPHEDLFQAEASSVRAVVERIVPLRKSCAPTGRGPYCPRQWNFVFENAETYAVASLVPFFPGPFVFSLHQVGTPPNGELQIIGQFDGGTEVTRSQRVTVDATQGGPFLSGAISFDRAGLLPTHHSCKATIHRHRWAWTSGAFGLNYDTGTITLTGPDLRATSSRLIPDPR